MKRKFKIIFEVDCNYPNIDNTVPIKSSKKMIKDFDQWLKDWAMDDNHTPLPLLYKKFKNKPSEECATTGRVVVKVERDKEVILHKAYDEWDNL